MMSWTVYNDDLITAETLIKAGVNLNATDRSGDTVLHNPFISPAMARLLLKAGAKVDSINLNRETPLAKVLDTWRSHLGVVLRHIDRVLEGFVGGIISKIDGKLKSILSTQGHLFPDVIKLFFE